MGSKFVSFILTVVVILLITCMAILGINIYKDLSETKVEVGSYEYIPDGTNVELKNTLETPKVVTNPLEGIESTYSQTQVEYSDSNSIQNFFYEQLNEYSKIIYNGLENNKTNMITGTYKVEFGSKFSDVLKNDKGDEQLQQYYQAAIEAFMYDNPDVFYLDPTKMYLNIATTTYSTGEKAFQVYIDNGNKPNYLIDEFSSRDQVNNALLQVEQIKNQILNQRTGNTLNDIKMVHDYLIDTIEYDETISKENIYNMYGALINRVCVCEGYARAFKYILEDMGVPCILRVGTGTNAKGQTERHAWNYVQFGGKWYAVDVTWDDPVVMGNGRVSESEKTKYFMKTGAEFNSAHVPSNSFTEGGKEFQFPEI